MDRVLFAIVTAAGTAFAALAPADANSVDSRSDDKASITRVRATWRADATTSNCRIEMRWKRDYAGALYLNKVRVCA